MPFNPSKFQWTSGNAVAAATTAVSPTTNGSIDDVTGTHNQAILNKNFKELQNQIDAILVALRSANIIP